MLTALIAAVALAPVPHSFVAKDGQFLLDGKPFVVRSGEMHYPRIPQAYWHDRLRKAKQMGLNTICTYVFWNLHEPKPGRFDFGGNLDVAAFVKAAQSEGLYVILRPGPYICTELDFGGLPAWLLKDRSMTVRSNDPRFMKQVKGYFDQLGKRMKPLLIQNGGPVIMTQVENEYGSYGHDHEYMRSVQDALVDAGFTGQLFTSDGPGQGMLSGGTLPNLPAAVNFGGGAEGAFKELEKFRPGSPRMIGEYWCGWFDHWGKPHHTTSTQAQLKDIQWCLDHDVSFNLYMFHGGTNWAFMQGSNGSRNDYNVDTTSYDYDAPVDEGGRPTAKYFAFRDAILNHTGEKPNGEPAKPATMTLPPIEFTGSAPLWPSADRSVLSKEPPSFEDMDQSYGLVYYTIHTSQSGSQRLEVGRLADYATVFVDGKRVGTLDRRLGQHGLDLNLPPAGASIGLLVESMSRVNFGPLIPTERKGIEQVSLGGQPLEGWTCLQFPLQDLKQVRFGKLESEGPRFYRANFRTHSAADTYLDMRTWNKGFVWLNGHNLGRFWKIGPQQTLYAPGCWINKGINTLVVYDEGPKVDKPVVVGLAEPILNQVERDLSRLHRKPGQTLDLGSYLAVAQGEFAPGTDWQAIPIHGEVYARYLVFESLSEQNGQPFAAVAELELLDAEGNPIPRDVWKVLYADSEEIDAENGSASNVLDQQPTTFWHTEWSAQQPNHPHDIVIDLGATREVRTVRYLPRQDAKNGRVKRYRVLLAKESPVKG